MIDDAKKHGAKVVTGGQQLSSKGYFIAPTIVSEISDGVRLVDEEQFGPALPVIPYRNVEDAVERANATHYGLSRLGVVGERREGDRGRARSSSAARPG